MGKFVFGIAGVILVGDVLRFGQDIGLLFGSAVALIVAVYLSFDLIGCARHGKPLYNVLQASTGKYVAVKQGFSWPAFFFGIIWLLLKRLWPIAAIGILVAFLVAASMNIDRSFALLTIISLAWRIVLGINGNAWLESDLVVNRKYILRGSSDAPSRKAATSEYQDDRKSGTETNANFVDR